MRLRPPGSWFLLAALLVAGCAASPLTVQTELRGLQTPGPQVWAYHAHWMLDTWRLYDLRDFDRILFFDLVAGKDGGIAEANGWPERWAELRRAAAQAGTPVEPVVSVLGMDAFRAIFSNPESASRFASTIAPIARDAGGVHLDFEVFEPLDDRSAEGFRAFLERLRHD